MIRQRKVRVLLILGTAFALALGVAALLVGVPASAQGTTPTPCPFGNITNGGMMGRGGMMGQGGMMGGSNQHSSQQCAELGGMMNMMGGSGIMDNMMLGGMMMGGMMNPIPDRAGNVGPGNGMMGAWTP